MSHQTRFSTSRGMNNIEDRHFSLNRALLLAIGLWPYQKSILARLHLICFFSILISRIIFQLIIFITSKSSTDVTIKILTPTSSCIIFVIMYNSFYVNRQTVKCLMEQLQRICDDLKDNNEIAIIERYGSNAKRFTASITMFIIIVICLFIIAQMWPDFLNIILSANKSRLLHLEIMTEYSVIKERYFYLQLLHINMATCIGILTMLATGTMLNAYLQHACGMFTIASYRIEHAMKIHLLQNINPLNDNLVYEGIICAIDIHRKAMMFSEHLISEFEISYIFLIVFGVTTVSFNTFQIVSSNYNIEELSIPLMIVSISFLYMFVSNLIGQEITDHSNYVYATAYKVHWYIAPLHTQRLILFLLQRGSKIFNLNIGGLYVASLRCLAMMLKTVISYVTVMCSIR